MQVLQPREEREDCARLICMCKHARGMQMASLCFGILFFFFMGSQALLGRGGN